MVRTAFLTALLALGCGSSDNSPADNDAGATDGAADGGGETPIAKRAVEAVLADYLAAWSEPDATKRNAKLAASVTPDVVYTDPTGKLAGSAAISKAIADAITKYRGTKMTLTSGPDSHHDRLRFHWRYTDKTDAPIAEGVDHVTIGADGRFTLITGHYDPVAPAPPSLDPALALFRDAFSAGDDMTRVDMLKKSLAGVFIDKTGGPLDAAGLGAKIGMVLKTAPAAKLTYEGFTEHDGGFRIPYTFGDTKGVLFGRRDTGGLIAEVTSFEGDAPKL